nr:MAG TPA: glycoprotein [Bacteriophage sp.]
MEKILDLFNFVYGIVVMSMFVIIAICCVIVTIDAIKNS